ncbi:MAG: septum formation family protein [Acidimicrobiia bacterium]
MTTRPLSPRAVAWLVVMTLAVVGCSGGGQSVFDLEVGNCFDDTEGSGPISSVPAVDCAEPHDNEVFAVLDYTDAETYPGTEAMREAARDLCIEQFDAYVGLPYLDSALEVFAITPTEGSWDSGDREVVCSLYNADLSNLTGSMRGAER